MRLTIILLSLAALACTKKQDSPPAEAEAPAVSEAPAPTDKARNAEEAQKAAEKLAADLAAANEGLPEALEGDPPELGKPATLAVIDTGAEPKERLRLELPAGFEEKVTIDAGIANQAVVAVFGMRNPEYVVTFDVTLKAGKPGKGGLTRVELTVDDAQIDSKALADEKLVAALNDALVGVRKLSGHYLLGLDGRVSEIRLEAPTDVPPKSKQHAKVMTDNLRLAILGLTPALPNEPVGKGAKWSSHQTIEQGGARVNQLSTFELLSRNADTAELKVKARQTAKPQEYESQGFEYELDTLRGDASGTLTWSAKHLVAPSADLSSNVIKGLRYQKDGQTAGIAVSTDRTVRVGDAD